MSGRPQRDRLVKLLSGSLFGAQQPHLQARTPKMLSNKVLNRNIKPNTNYSYYNHNSKLDTVAHGVQINNGNQLCGGAACIILRSR